MNNRHTYLSAVLLGVATLIGGASPAFAAASAPSLGTASSFAVLGGAVACTDSTITGDIGSSGAWAPVRCVYGEVRFPPVLDPVVTDFNGAYDAFAAVQPCDRTFTDTDTLAGVTLRPGVYCFDAAATLAGTLTLAGPSTGIWIFKVGTGITGGALTGNSFSVVMDGNAVACNVYWWVHDAATMTASNFKGTILAGAGITFTGGTFAGRALAKAGVTLTNVAATGCGSGAVNPPKQSCNQGVGNGPEACDPGNSNQGFPFRSNDEIRGTSPGNPGRKGGNK